MLESRVLTSFWSTQCKICLPSMVVQYYHHKLVFGGLIACNRILIEKLVVAQVLKKVSTFYGTQ
jgi:hypothetical protein